MIKKTENFYFFIIIVFISLFLFSEIARSHSWYDYRCCSDNDCNEVLSKEDTEHDSWIITSKNGVVLVPYNFPKLPSQDEKEHICMYFDGVNMIPRCYYVPAGV